MKNKTQTAKVTKYIKGSRIPLSFFFDYILEGYTISDFISSYPWIKKKDVAKLLEEVDNNETSKYALG